MISADPARFCKREFASIRQLEFEVSSGGAK
jgi:hypothetical protein